VASANEPTPEISENSLALDNTGILLHYKGKGDLAEDTIMDKSLLGAEASPLVDVDASNYHYYAQNNKSATVMNSVTLDQGSPHNSENLLSEPAKKSVAILKTLWGDVSSDDQGHDFGQSRCLGDPNQV